MGIRTKVLQQPIFAKTSKYNCFLIISHLLNIFKIAISCFILGQSQQNLTNIQAHNKSLESKLSPS